MKPILICGQKNTITHSTAWGPRWAEYCKEKNIPYEIVDCLQYDIVQKLPNYSALLWHYSNYSLAHMMEARNIIQVASNLGLITFPYPEMNWHFDDKVAEMYALQAVKAPIPESWVFYREEECIVWLENHAQFPLVAKLRCGSGSNNVKLLHNNNEAKVYVKRMFTKGYQPAPSVAYKAFSKLQSSKNMKMIVNRIKKIPEFLRTRRGGKMLPIEKGYCYFQEFIPNDGYDLKVVVIGDKMTFCARNVRKDDFRASGGGDCYYDRNLLTNGVIDSAFEAARKLNMYCVGFDYVVDAKSGVGKIIEMCYGFDYEVQRALGAYVDRNHVWHEEPVSVPDEIINMIIRKV